MILQLKYYQANIQSMNLIKASWLATAWLPTDKLKVTVLLGYINCIASMNIMLVISHYAGIMINV